MSPAPHETGFVRKTSTLGALAWLHLGWVSHAAVTVRFEQSGNDTIVTTTGTLNLTGLSSSWSAWEMEDAYYRQIGGGLPQDLVRLFRDSVTAYEFPMGGNLFSKGLPVLVADAYSGNTFGLWANASLFSLYVPRGFRSGPIVSSMTFRNLSLESLGVIDQVIQLGASDGLRITLTTVPEIGTASLSALALAGVAFRRRR